MASDAKQEDRPRAPQGFGETTDDLGHHRLTPRDLPALLLMALTFAALLLWSLFFHRDISTMMPATILSGFWSLLFGARLLAKRRYRPTAFYGALALILAEGPLWRAMVWALDHWEGISGYRWIPEFIFLFAFMYVSLSLLISIRRPHDH